MGEDGDAAGVAALGGWNITGPAPAPSALALLIEVPWTETNKRHRLLLTLQDQDGRTVELPTPMGVKPMEVSTEFEVGRPPGSEPGAPLSVPLALALGPLPLTPGSRYVWQCSIDGNAKEEWRVSFSTRPTQGPLSPAA